VKALVIGGTGPTGPVIVTGLQNRGYDVTILHRGTHEVPQTGDVEHIHVDPHFTEEITPALQGRHYDLVIATYGRLRLLVEPVASVSDRLISVGGTVYSFHHSLPATENDQRRVENPLAEKIVQTENVLLEAHQKELFSLTHFRYPGLYGPRQIAPREWSVIRRILDGNFYIPVADGGLTLQSRAYVENAAFATMLAVDHPEVSSGQMYNVADEYTPSDADRAYAIAAAMGQEIELVNYPLKASRPAYFWGVSRDLDFHQTGNPPSTGHQLLDIAKIQSQLGYLDAVDFKTAVQRTVDYYVENPLERGGADEERIGDPFDYAAEAAYREELFFFQSRVAQIEYTDFSFKHMYDHPQTPTRTKE
jgi:nucleoside-diphosphate-sugar epimerase